MILITSPVKLPVDIELICVNPILTQQDFINMRNKGIPRKTTLAHYYSINQHLDFLTDDQRLRVLDVIQKELGNQLEKKTIKKINKLSDLLMYENMRMVDEKMSWQESVYVSTDILLQKGLINKSKDKKEHIPAIITWGRMITNTDVIAQLTECDNLYEAYQILLNCERKVI